MNKNNKAATEAVHVSSSHRAHAQLREQLLRSKFLPGQKINEVALAKELEISRTPLREALNRLVAEGLLMDRERGFSVPGLEPEAPGVKPVAKPVRKPEAPEVKPVTKPATKPEAPGVKLCGKALVGRRVLVYWGGDDGAAIRLEQPLTS